MRRNHDHGGVFRRAADLAALWIAITGDERAVNLRPVWRMRRLLPFGSAGYWSVDTLIDNITTSSRERP